MATVTVSGGAFNMGIWSVSFIMSFLNDLATVGSGGSTTQVTFTQPGSGVTLVAQGVGFSNYDSDGYPFVGTIQSFQYTETSTGSPITIAMSGISISIPTLYNWIATNNVAAVQSAVFDGADTFNGSAFGEVLHGYGGADVINGNDGNDDLIGGLGNDTLNGGDGNDQLDIGGLREGVDTLNGGAGDDVIGANAGDIVDGGSGNDRVELTLTSGNVSVSTLGMSEETGVTLSDGTFIKNVETIALYTGAGNDTLTIHASGTFGSRFYGGAGTDTLIADFSGSSADWNLNPSGQFNIGAFAFYQLDSIEQYQISTGSGADSLRGGTGNDILSAGAGNDELSGGAGVNVLNGGDGNDRFVVTNGVDTIDGGSGTDTVVLSPVGDTVLDWNALVSGSFNGSTFVNVEKFEVSSGAFDDLTVTITGPLAAGGVIRGSTYGDSLVAADFSGSATPVSLNWQTLTQGGHELTFWDLTALVVTGGAGNDVLTGFDWDDTLNGGDGNDTLRGYEGDDVLNGGAGDDVIEFMGYAGWGTDTIDGGDGTDTLRLLLLQSNGIAIDSATFAGAGATLQNGSTIKNMELLGDSTLGTGDDVLDITGGYAVGAYYEGNSGFDRLIADFTGEATPVSLTFNSSVSVLNGVTFTGFEVLQITGGSGADALAGGLGADIIAGGEGSDVIGGGAGDDVLHGGAGADALNGGDGVDTADYGSSTARVVVRLSTGLGESAHAQGDTLSGIENLTGSAFNDALIGSAGANALSGGLGNDYLDGGAANDVLDGGEGDDRLVGGLGADQLIGGAGVDLADYSTGTGRVVIRLWNGTGESGAAQGDTLSGIENVTGTTANDSLIGGANANVLRGGAGNDYLDGLEGDDILIGGAGADNMVGGIGVDTVSYEDATARVVIRLSNQTAVEGEAAGDIISGFENATGGAGNDALIGDGFANTLDGRGGNDYLDGGLGNDILIGGAGDDRLVGGAGPDAMNGGDGIDLADYSSATARVVVRLSTGLGESNHAQGDTLANIENLTGSNFNDALIGANTIANVLRGGGGDDYLDGLSGNDYLDGGAGADRLNGGLGADTFAFVAGQGQGDQVLDFASGQDQLRFEGYGAGATLTQLDATHWRVASADGLTADVITIANAATLNPGDWLFV